MEGTTTSATNRIVIQLRSERSRSQWWIGSSIYDAVYNSVAKGLEDWDILPKKKK